MAASQLRAVWVCLVACTGQPASLPRADPAQYRIEPVIAVSPPDAAGTFHFSLCGPAFTGDARVYRAFVSRAGLLVGAPIDAASLVCIANSEHAPAFGSAWQYGFHAHGFEKDSACPPLRTDTQYEISVSGIGDGSLAFTVDANGVGRAVSRRNACQNQP